ncbi:hypothetical protein ACSRUE_21340 [Sorangium sp. KYC3313]|uniref:hypothetical protein n=1 Tax=Sorangium sp. KYC3313 TaxID=3449740 RepID=UPI003F88F087
MVATPPPAAVKLSETWCPLEAKAPPGLGPGLAEEGEVVTARVAERRVALDAPEDALEQQDALELAVALRAKAGPEQHVRRAALAAVHVADREAGATARDVMPVLALAALEREPGGFARETPATTAT